MKTPILFFCLLFLPLAGPSCGGDKGPRAEISFSGPLVFPTTAEPAGVSRREPGRTSYVTFSLTIRPGERIAPGGGLRIEQGRLFEGRPVYGSDLRYALPDPVPGEGPGPNRLTVSAGGVPCMVVMHPSGLGRHAPQVVFPEGLDEGKAVTVVFGDTSAGGKGVEVPVIPMKIRLLTFLDCSGTGDYRLAEGSRPLLESRAMGADRLRVTAPSVVEPGPVGIRIVPVRGGGGRTSSSLPVHDFSGEVVLFQGGGDRTPLGRISLEAGELFKNLVVRLDRPGVFRLEAVCPEARISGRSNPVLVLGGGGGLAAGTLGSRRILWGSIQNHTALGGHALGLPGEAFETARGPGCLDFCAVTDHSSNPSFHWKELRNLADRYDRPGSFVAFPGYEWTSEVHGHRHIILKDGSGTKAASERPTGDPAEMYAPGLSDLARAVGSDPNALIIVHHTTWLRDPAFPDYDFGRPGELPRQRLFEIFSWHGSAESGGAPFPPNGNPAKERRPGSSFRDVLAAGRRFFVTADSDEHAGMPGIPVAVVRRWGMRYGLSGVTAVMASSFDREGVFSALEEGRCYGTTGARILVFLRIGGAGLGEERLVEGETRVEAEIHGTGDLEEVALFRDGKDLVLREEPGGADFSRAWILPEAPGGGLHSYYLRVRQKDGHRAWTSPVWVGKGGKGR